MWGASPLLSLRYFKPAYMSLAKPSPILTTAISQLYEVIKASIQALFLSGRYRTERLSRHFPQNPEGVGKNIPDALRVHVLVQHETKPWELHFQLCDLSALALQHPAHPNSPTPSLIFIILN